MTTADVVGPAIARLSRFATLPLIGRTPITARSSSSGMPGRPFIYHGVAYVPLHKVGGFGEGFMTRSEGVVLASNNLLAEDDPNQIRWETLPDGDVGLRTPPAADRLLMNRAFRSCPTVPSTSSIARLTAIRLKAIVAMVDAPGRSPATRATLMDGP